MTRLETIALLVELGLLKTPDNSNRIVVQLGKYGDIINILPALRIMSQQCGAPVKLMVAEKYWDVVNGLSYVESIIFQGDFFNDFNAAVKEAQSKYAHVIVSQVTGKDYSYTRVESHFNMESWRMLGMGQHFFTAPLVLDNREFRSEEAVANSHIIDDKPNVLVNLSGTSSPFPASPTLMEWLRTALPEVNVVNLGALQVPIITDLLGLYDRSVCLVTCDTATLHLARSHPIPVIALCADKWNGTNPVANTFFRCTYPQVWRHLTTICEIVRRCAKEHVPHPRVIHLRQNYQASEEAKAREEVALATWEYMYQRGVIRMDFSPSNYPTAQDIGDSVNAPNLKAVLDKAILDNPQDIVVFANNDICINKFAVPHIRQSVNCYGCAYAARVDFKAMPMSDEEAWANVSVPLYAGSDLFAFSYDWWKKHRDNVPDLYLGFEGFDFVLRAMMYRSGCQRIRENIIYHQIHESSKWKGQNERPAQKHNRSVCRKWAIENGFEEYLQPDGSEYLFKATQW